MFPAEIINFTSIDACQCFGYSAHLLSSCLVSDSLVSRLNLETKKKGHWGEMGVNFTSWHRGAQSPHLLHFCRF